MNIMIVGSGGREHSLAWKLAQSPQARLFCLPGNPGTAQLGTNLPGKVENIPGIVTAARDLPAGLVVIGPEAPLAAGLADELREAGCLVFGPSQAAAQIEASKLFAKAFMVRYAIPTAYHQAFDQFEDAAAYLRSQPSARRVVIKASGLAAGKGVYLPETYAEGEAILRMLLLEGGLGSAGQQVVIEERLHGREVSVLAFTDGRTLAVMPPVQDHKRLMDGDEGPNTGGMGTFAPSPYCPAEVLQQVLEKVLHPAVEGLREEGKPFNGVLYAGMIITADGPRVLEFNARFGDPETQVLLPLLDSDLLEILLACAQGQLGEVASKIQWRPGAAACVVLASPGYPERPQTGQVIHGLEAAASLEDTWVFHAGTKFTDGQVRTAGGRVLGVSAYAGSLEQAIEKAYAGVKQVHFEGMHYRRDIGRTGSRSGEYPNDYSDAGSETPPKRERTAYEAAGVSIEAGNRAVSLMRQAVRSTFTPQVLSDVGAFGGLFSATDLQTMRHPVLVASTDGIGTKVDLAAQTGRFANLGLDIVNHCINDILVQGARPLFFLDYIASGELDPEMVAELVGGMSAACRAAGCCLIGGETAEMPGVYAAGRFDVAGTMVGVVEREAIYPRPGVQPGDLLLGLASSGPHTNGYSLIRRIFSGALDVVFPELGGSAIDVLLAPHRSYLPILDPVLRQGVESPIKALAHITGGGFFDNLPRVLPQGCGAKVFNGSWPVLPVFSLIQRLGQVEDEEMFHVFNMGIGMVAIVPPTSLAQIQTMLPEPTWVIGEVVEGKGVTVSKQ